MRSRKDRRKPTGTTVLPSDDVSKATPDRRKLRDRRIENLNAEERQLLLSEMPGLKTGKPVRKG